VRNVSSTLTFSLSSHRLILKFSLYLSLSRFLINNLWDNGKLHWTNDIDKSLNESNDDKIRKYHGDYNHNPPTTNAFMSPITSDRLRSDLIRILFLQDHRETDYFFVVSGVQSTIKYGSILPLSP
jgi:hypothetical protein